MTEKTLTVTDFETMQRMSLALYKSGYFSDVKSEAQAIVKVMAGAELGLPPFASMTGIHIIQGKPSLGANLVATLVKNDARYDYRVIECDDTKCLIDWYENGNKVGQSQFTFKEASQVQQYNNKTGKWESLTSKPNWKSYPSDMLFARAISRGARRFAPGIFGGSPVYTPDELNVDTDPDGFIEGELVQPDEPIAPDAQDFETEEAYQEAEQEYKEAREAKPNGNGHKLMNAPKFRLWIMQHIDGFKNDQHVLNTIQLLGYKQTPTDPDERRRLVAALTAYREARAQGMSQDDALASLEV